MLKILDFPLNNENGVFLYLFEYACCGQLNGEDEVKVVVGLGVVGKHMRGGATVEADVLDVDVVGLKLGAHQADEIAQAHLQRGEVAAAVHLHHLLHDCVEPTHLLEAQHRQSLLLVFLVDEGDAWRVLGRQRRRRRAPRVA